MRSAILLAPICSGIASILKLNIWRSSSLSRKRESRCTIRPCPMSSLPCRKSAPSEKRKLLGAHILGEEAGTMIHQLVLAMTLNATIDDLARMITVHPALPEVVASAVDDVVGKL